MEAAKQFRKRNAILACLQRATTHPSAEMVYEMLQKEHPDISLATVYRNLARFKSQGLVNSVATVHGVERFDAMTHPHVHFICSSCDAVRYDPWVDREVRSVRCESSGMGDHVPDPGSIPSGEMGQSSEQRPYHSLLLLQTSDDSLLRDGELHVELLGCWYGVVPILVVETIRPDEDLTEQF